MEKLYELFKVISSSGDDDGLIDKSEFQQALGLKRNLFVDRMFELFDANGDKNINFTEFVAGLSVFTFRAKAAEKARFSFRMYDFNGDGKIDKAELGRMLQATIEENSLNITPEAAQELLDATFVEAERRGGDDDLRRVPGVGHQEAAAPRVHDDHVVEPGDKLERLSACRRRGDCRGPDCPQPVARPPNEGCVASEQGEV